MYYNYSIMPKFDTTLVEKPVTTKDFISYDIHVLPKIILGFILNNKYDQERLKLKSTYNPKNILHFVGNGSEIEPIYLHGIELEPCKNIYNVCKSIQRAQPITLNGYMNILKYNGLSCDSVYGYLADGMYPIDIKHLSNINTSYVDHGYKRLRDMLIENKDMPWFSSWSDFKVLILLPSELY